MGNITLNKPSGGQLTIAPEDGTSNETVSIPSVGVGKVLQVVQVTHNGEVETTSNSFVSSGKSISITPTASNSKIYIQCQLFMKGNTNGYGMRATLFRDGSNVASSSTQALAWARNVNAPYYHTFPIQFLDNAGTTSEITYTVYIRSDLSGSTIRLGENANDMIWTIWEVAA